MRTREKGNGNGKHYIKIRFIQTLSANYKIKGRNHGQDTNKKI